jgi:L-iditol 2-dehydrogenase
VTFDASGNPGALASTIHVTRRGGAVVWIGLPAEDSIPIPVPALIDKEIDLRGVFRYANAHPLAIDLMATGAIDTDLLITHHFPLEQSADALELTASHKPGVIKVLIEPNPETTTNGHTSNPGA